MKTKILLQRAIPAGILLIAIILIGLTYHSKTKFKNLLTDEKRKSEVLLSEKLTLNKAIKNYQADVADLQKKSNGLSKLIAEANINIQNKNAEINGLKAVNGSLKDVKVKNVELEKLKLQLSEELAKTSKALTEAKSEYEKLNNQLALALETNEDLESDNAILKELFSYNYRTEALRGKNEKLTVIAKKTSKLLVYFDLPGNINNNINFKVVTPQGKELSSNKDLAATIRIIENGDGLMASADQNSGGSAGTKRVEMSYKPSKKLSKGIYQFNLYNEDRFLGSTQLRLK